MKQLDLLKARKREEFAKLILAEWEARVAKRRFDRILLVMRTKKYLEGSAAVTIQAIWRGHFLRQYLEDCAAIKCHNSALLIQTTSRMWSARKQYKKCRKGEFKSRHYCSIFISGCISLILFIWVHLDIVTCQYAAMKFLAQKHLRGLLCMNAFIKRLQSWARSYIAARRLAQYRRNIIVIQSFVRMGIASNRFRTVSRGKLSERIIVLHWLRRCNLTMPTTATLACQHFIRINLAKQHVQRLRDEKKMNKARVTIQKFARCWLAKMHYKEEMKGKTWCYVI